METPGKRFNATDLAEFGNGSVSHGEHIEPEMNYSDFQDLVAADESAGIIWRSYN